MVFVAFWVRLSFYVSEFLQGSITCMLGIGFKGLGFRA